jgi:hypothetical protein
MIRTFLLALLAVNLTGCASLSGMQTAYQEHERETQARIDQLSPEDRDKVGKCVAVAEGRIATLRSSDQQAFLAYAATNELSIANDCLANPYYYASIPNPPPPPSTVTCNTIYGPGMATTRCN